MAHANKISHDANFLNRTLWIDDNLRVLRGINSECVDLIYLDPPFNSNRFYNAPLGSEAAGAQFDDTWSLDAVKAEWSELQEAANPALYHTIIGAGLSAGESMQAYLSFMALRVQECHRILKPTGSLYLHCDPHASHYLKQLADVVFGAQNIRNEIVWCYTGPGNVTRHFKRKLDTILFYGKTSKTTLNLDAVRIPYSKETLARRGRTEGMKSIISSSVETNSRRSAAEVEARFGKGKVPEDWWVDIAALTNQPERTGWPTQKPLALLERIIEASSNPGDLVVDPFAGCATTCVAAELAGRRWAGIDIDPKALEVTMDRLRRQVDLRNTITADKLGTTQMPGFARDKTSGDWILPKVTATGEIPVRTDPTRQTRSPRIREIRWHELGEGDCRPCAGCGKEKYREDFHLDHIVPLSKGGQDIDANLQLLCAFCNVTKGNRLTMAELRQRLVQRELGLTS